MNSWNEDSRPVARGEVWVQRHGDRHAVYDAGTGRLHLLNASALAIWELCDGYTTPEEMAEAIAELSDVDRKAARRDVFDTLTSLEQSGLVASQHRTGGDRER